MNKIFLKETILVLVLFIINSISYAHSIQGNWYIGENIGVAFPKIIDNHFVATGIGWPDDQYSNHNIDSAAFFSLLGGYQWSTQNNWIPFFSLGIRYSYVTPSTVNGTILQYSLPEFENYNFQYKIQRQTYLGMIKANIVRYYNVMPFLTVGLGWSTNKVSHYFDTPLLGITPRISPAFQNHTNSHFSYILGAGIDYIVKNNLWLGLEYHYGDFGQAQTGFGILTYSNEYLKTKLTGNTIALNINYIFNYLV
ncbi:TPA: outer membrane protein [Legionella pneumophila]